MDGIQVLLADTIQKQLTLRQVDYWKKQIPEKCIPILWFGEHRQRSLVSTLGANPSRTEFFPSRQAAKDGELLDRQMSRFYTFTEEDLSSPTKPEILAKIIQSYDKYFNRNPYTRWFGKPSTTGAYNLEGFLNGVGASFYKTVNLGCIHLDLVPFTTLDDFSQLDEAQLKPALFYDGWAKQNLIRLLELLNPQRIFVLGRKNVEWFNKFYYPLKLDNEYHRGSTKARYGLSRIQVGHSKIPIAGVSVNLGNPIGFDKNSLHEFGAFFRSII